MKRDASPSPIVVRTPTGFVERVDPATRQCTGEPQQFRRADDGTLTIVPRAEWIADPAVVDVNWIRYG